MNLEIKNAIPEGELKRIVEEYRVQEYLEDNHRKGLEKRIKLLEEQILASLNGNIYYKLYKPEYGDYREFVQTVAEKLREENKTPKKK